MNARENSALLSARGLVKNFRVKRSLVQAVSGVDLDILAGETLCLVGESGCGKSTFGRLLLRLIDPDAGSIIFDGKDISKLKGDSLKAVRRRMQFIFQDPYASLDPRMTVGQIVEEPLANYRIGSSASRKERVFSLLDATGIPREYYWRYPHQFSGGQRQRVGIARALALDPALVVCDEPVSALDVSIQAQILNLLADLQEELSLTYLFISHDLGVVKHIADRICVMFLGKICEVGNAKAILANPAHPYTRFLLSATPSPDPRQRKEDKDILTGDVPSPINPPSGCRFRKRCPFAKEICAREEPAPAGDASRTCYCHFPLA